MSRSTQTAWSVCLFAAAFALAAPGCDDPAVGDGEVAQPNFTPPYDPTPEDISAAPEDCDCPKVGDPVCGSDGGTYANACKAACADVEVEHDGPCIPTQCANDEACGDGEFCDFGDSCGGVGTCAPEPEFCYRKLAPVCGCDGETYENSCLAHAAGVSVAEKGECADACVCTLEYVPVCGTDGETYGNACAAGCADVEVEHEGACEAPCDHNGECGTGRFCQRDESCGGGGTCVDQPQVCADIYQPVCGCDGKTYGNACEAHAAGISFATEGACDGIDFE